MANIAPAFASRPLPNPVIGEGVLRTVTWETLTSANAAGTGVEINGDVIDAVFQIIGTFDSATVVIQGSNDGGTTWTTLLDTVGLPMSFTAAGMAEPIHRPGMFRPSTSGGSGSQDIDVILSLRTARA